MSEGVFYDYVFVSQIVYLHVSTVSCDCLVRYILSGQLFIWHDITGPVRVGICDTFVENIVMSPSKSLFSSFSMTLHVTI